MDRFDELVVFTAILDAGTLAGAARRLRRSSPAVTRSLAALEERVGARLVQRTTRKLALTDAGRAFAARARQILADYGEATGTLHDDKGARLHGVLRVAAPSLLGRLHITPLMASFLEAHPDIRIELILGNTNVDLIEDGFDVAIRLGPLSDSRLITRQIGKVREILVASRKYLALRGTPRKPRDLSEHDIVINSSRSSSVSWRFRAKGRDKIVRLTPRMVVSDTEAMITAIRNGLGVGRALYYQTANDLHAGTIVRLLQDYETAARPIHLVIPTARHVPHLVRVFLDHAYQALSGVRSLHDE